MKKLLLLLIPIMMGCGVDPPIFTGEKAFIIDEITSTYDGCTYTAKEFSNRSISLMKPCFVDDCNKFQIGDTIKLIK